MLEVDRYRQLLRNTADWPSLLRRESNLPGPRGNLELAQAVAEEGAEDLLRWLAAFGPDHAPTNTPDEFLAFCGVLGLGRLLVEGDRDVLATLRAHANDPRWRLREAVATALQRYGDADMDALASEMETWSEGTWLEKRAYAAALCEPRLLVAGEDVARVLGILDRVTASLVEATDRRSSEFLALRKGLGYCWSVAVAALPDVGKPMMARWFQSDNRDVRWIMRQNLKKKRLARMDARWVEDSLAQLSG